MSLLDGLNPEQRAAAAHKGSPLIVLAGPGTGKTRVITHRLAKLIEDGASPESVLALTFTNKAAEEMRERLAGLVDPLLAGRVFAGTFHSFGRGVLSRFGDSIGLEPRPMLIDSAQRKALLDEALLLAADAGEVPAGRVAAGGNEAAADHAWAWISHLRSSAVFADDTGTVSERWRALIAEHAGEWDDARAAAERSRLSAFEEAAAVYRRFEALCAERGFQTFDDQVIQPIRVLRGSGHARALLRDEIRHVVVDEFQDVNPAQLALLRELAPPTGSPDLCVVGDDDQSIYGFRGSDTRAFRHFAETWTDAVTLTLTVNYRSTPAIVEASQRIIERAGERFDPGKSLQAGGELAGETGPVEAIHLEDDAHAGEMIAAMIRADRADRADRAVSPGKPWSAYAVIATTHSTLDGVGDALELAGVPVVRSKPGVALDDDGVQDVLAWIRWLIEDDGYSAVRLLTRPPYSVERTEAVRLHSAYRRATARQRLAGDETPPFAAWLRETVEPPEGARALLAMHDRLAAAAAGAAAHEAVSAIIEQGGMAHAELMPGRSRAKRVAALVEVLRFTREATARIDPPGDLAAFWAHYLRLDPGEQAFRFEDDSAAEDPGAGEGVRLISAHQSKGLQFDTVFIPRIGATTGCFGFVGRREAPSLPAELSGESHRDERDEVRRLFYVAMTRAERRLVLLAKRAKTRSKSMHFLHELAWRGTTPLARGEADGPAVLLHAEDVLDRAAAAGVPVAADPIAGEAAGPSGAGRARAIARVRRQARLRAAEALDLAEAEALSEAGFEDVVDRLRSAAATLSGVSHVQRGGGDAMPPWVDGDASLALHAILAAHGGVAHAPERLRWPGLSAPLELSYSKIDAYRRCPACFYLEHVLGLGEPPSTNLVLGNAAHTALERFYLAWTEADNEGRPRPGKPALIEHGRAAYFELLRGEADGTLLARVTAQLDAGYDTFHSDNAEIMMIEEKAAFGYQRAGGGDDQPHTIRAKLDRVDRLGDGFRIIDYKTGKARKSLDEPKPDDLQLGIYAMALAHLLGIEPEALTGEACYWLLGVQRIGSVRLEDMDLAAVRAAMDTAIEGMLEGRFDPNPRCTKRCRVFVSGAGDGAGGGPGDPRPEP